MSNTGLLKKTLMSEDGATAIEYGLIAALIAIGIVGSLSTVGASLQTNYGKTANALNK